MYVHVFAIAFRWKEECQTITQKFELKVTDLRSEMSREKKRVGELTRLLRDSKNKTADVSIENCMYP